MKRYFSFVLCLSTLLLCCACTSSSDSPDTEPVISDAEQTEIDGPAEVVERIMTNEFNHETNQLVVFQGYQFEIPQNWQYIVNEEEAVLHFYPHKEEPPFFSFTTLISEEKYASSIWLYDSSYINRERKL